MTVLTNETLTNTGATELGRTIQAGFTDITTNDI